MTTPFTAADWIRALDLQPHPEGGYYREVYRSAETIPPTGLPPRYTSERAFSTSIYFLLENDQSSVLHRLKSDELWHFYAGQPLTIHVFKPDGRYQPLALGPRPEQGDQFQAVVRAGAWFGAERADAKGYSLVGCTVAPGFDFSDFEYADREALAQTHPRQAPVIRKLTRP